MWIMVLDAGLLLTKKTNEFFGWTGLKLVTDEINQHSNYYDLGYRLVKRKWGQGIATETAIASLNYAFETLKAKEVCAMADCQNDASNRIFKESRTSVY